MRYVFEHEEITDCGMCPMLVLKQCSITGQRILRAGELEDADEADPYAFVRPEGECPLRDFDVEKRLYLIRFLEHVRNHILSKEWVEEIGFGLFSRKVRHTFAIDERNLKDIIDGIRERMEKESS